MKTIRPVLFLAAAALAWSCGGAADPDTVPPTNKATTLEVSIASVTLADDCGTGPTAIPSEPAATMDEAAGGSMGGASAKSQAYGDRACEQSSIQLRVANSTDAASKVVIQKVEVLDDAGTVVAELTPRAPSRWDNDAYQAWDEQVAPSQVLQVSYALTAPYVMRGATYTVRVTVAAGDDERTLEQKTTLEAEASLPPDAVT